MRILLFPSSYLPQLGGLEYAVAALARNLVARGHRVRVATFHTPDEAPDAALDDETPVLRMLYPHGSGGWRHPWAGLKFRRALRGCMEELRAWAGDVDVVNVHYCDLNALIALALAARTGIPCVVTFQGSDVMVVGAGNRFRRRLLGRVAAEAAAITAVSAALRDRFLDIVRPRAPLVQVIPNGFDPVQPLGEAPAGPFLLYAGRLEAVKGPDILLAAYLRSAVARRSLRLVYAGDGSLRSELERHARECGVSDRVDFLGRASRQQLAALFAACRGVVLPSRSEGLPLVLAEAMGAGAAVIGSSVGGVPELLEHGLTGLLVPPEDPSGLAGALDRAAVEAELFATMGTEAKVRSRSLLWENIAARYEDVYRGVLEGVS